MAYDEGLAERVRDLMADQYALSERKMSGGLCFMQDGTCASGSAWDGSGPPTNGWE